MSRVRTARTQMHRPPVDRQGGEGTHQDADEGGEAGRFGRGRHEAGRRRRGAVVDVGGPGVERHGRHLEPEAHDDQPDPGVEHALGQVDLGEERGDLVDAGRPGGPVDQGDAVQEDGRREGAEHEVLHGRLARLAAAAVVPGHHVERQRQDLETEEDDQEIVRLGHDHGPCRREQDQDVELRTVESFALQVAVGDQRSQDDGTADEQHEEDREAVEVEGVADRDDGLLVIDDSAPQPDRGAE